MKIIVFVLVFGLISASYGKSEPGKKIILYVNKNQTDGGCIFAVDAYQNFNFALFLYITTCHNWKSVWEKNGRQMAN